MCQLSNTIQLLISSMPLYAKNKTHGYLRLFIRQQHLFWITVLHIMAVLKQLFLYVFSRIWDDSFFIVSSRILKQNLILLSTSFALPLISPLIIRFFVLIYILDDCIFPLRMWKYDIVSYDMIYIQGLVVSVLACIMMEAGNPSNGRCPANYFYSSTSGRVGKWLHDHYLKLMNS